MVNLMSNLTNESRAPCLPDLALMAFEGIDQVARVGFMDKNLIKGRDFRASNALPDACMERVQQESQASLYPRCRQNGTRIAFRPSRTGVVKSTGCTMVLPWLGRLKFPTVSRFNRCIGCGDEIDAER